MIIICLSELFVVVFMWISFALSIISLLKKYQRIYNIAYKNKLTGLPSPKKFLEDYESVMLNFDNQTSYAYIIVDFSKISEYFSLHGKQKYDDLVISIGKVMNLSSKPHTQVCG